MVCGAMWLSVVWLGVMCDVVLLGVVWCGWVQFAYHSTAEEGEGVESESQP